MAGKCENFAGLANKRIVIAPPTETPDSYGGRTVTWATNTLDAWAIAEPGSGREVFGQGQDQSRVDMKFTIRYRSELKDTATASKYKITFDSRTFTVLYVKNLDEDGKREGKAFQVLGCVENGPENG